MRTVISSGRSPKTSATVCASTVPVPVPMSCTLESTSTEPSRITRTSQAELICTLAIHSDCATPRPRFTGPGSAPGGMPAPPADPLGADAPLFTPHRARIDALAQDQRVDAQAARPIRRSPARVRKRRACCPVHASRSPARH